MLLLRLPILEGKPRGPLIRPSLPTNLPITAGKKRTPDTQRSKRPGHHHPDPKRQLALIREPGVRIPGRNEVEDGGHLHRRHRVGRLGIRVIGCDGVGYGRREGDGAGQHDS